MFPGSGRIESVPTLAPYWYTETTTTKTRIPKQNEDLATDLLNLDQVARTTPELALLLTTTPRQREDFELPQI
ncbi:hypothetical protein TNCV_1205651 [Trichonephila clavipes]|nr:hypothetical protein TNCV_1205651 [Trichonephila clavipes]